MATRRSLRWIVAVGGALTMLGCAADGLTPAAPPAVARMAITLDYEAVLTFNADWQTVTEVGPIKAGGRLKLKYAADRLPNCRATKYGFDAWSILAYWKAPGHAPTYIPLQTEGAMLAGTLNVPEDVENIEVWFYNNDYYGCREYDSNLGKNYAFAVTLPAEAAELEFAGDWQERQRGTLEQGGLMRILFAHERLQTCRATSNGRRTWNIYAAWRFLPGGQTNTVSIIGSDPVTQRDVVLTPEVAVPEDATSVELWFSNSDLTGCSGWDSNLGANYAFAVSPADASGAPPVGWIGDYDFVTIANAETHLGNVDPAYYFDSWEGAPVGARVEVQVWIPGVTDRADGDPRDIAAAQVEAEVTTDAVGDGDAWGTWDLDYGRKQGNNFVYYFRFPELRWQTHGNNVPDGLYRWRPRFSTDAGATWTEGQTRRVVFAPTQDCSLFPDNAPPSCPKTAAVGWVGDWGNIGGHGCQYVQELANPKVYTKSAAGHDCMSITADVWIPGMTDSGADPSAILARVETNLTHYSGPLVTPTTHPLAFVKAVGNNYRFAWDVGQLVGTAERGDYDYRFRFSADGGATWKIAGLDGGEGWRQLHVRNDSSDTDASEYCDGIEIWSGPTAAYPYCVDYEPAGNYNAGYCELWVNAFGRGSWSHGGTTAGWLEAWVRVNPTQQGTVEAVGMWISYDEGGVSREVISIGNEVEPNYWKTGLTTLHSGAGAGAGIDRTPTAFAVFLDVRRPAGHVERLWQSGGGSNYSVSDVFAVAGYMHSVGSGSIEYADESVPLFDPKKSCGL